MIRNASTTVPLLALAAWVVYVSLPVTRVTGAPDAVWECLTDLGYRGDPTDGREELTVSYVDLRACEQR